MGQIKAPSYLVLRGNTYHFRLTLPPHARDITGKRELHFSLKTGYLRDASRLARIFSRDVLGIISESRHMVREDIIKIIQDHFKKLLNEDFENRIIHGPEYVPTFPGPDGNLIPIGEAKTKYFKGFLDKPIEDTKQIGKLVNDMFRSVNMNVPLDSRDYKLAVHDFHLLLESYFFSLGVRSYNPKEYDYVHWKLNEGVETVPAQHGTTPTPNPATHSLSQVFGSYVDERIKGNAWKPRTQKQNEDNFRWLADHFGDVAIESINGDMMRGFKEMLMNSNARNATKNPKPLSPRTIKNIQSSISAFFKYAKSNKYVKDNPTEGLTIKVKTGKDSHYDKFTEDDLRATFTVKGLDGQKNTKPWAFWIPVLCLFTGCRLEEIAQLLCSDVRQDRDIWYLDLVEGEGKSLKTESSTRKVPLHPFIVDILCFIKHVEQVKNSGHTRVFPELKKQHGKYGYGHAVSNWFNGRYLKTIKVKSPGSKKVLHSLRRTLITNLQHKEVEPLLLASIAGHEPGLITITDYADEFSLDMKMKALKKLDYGLDLSHLRHSKFVPK